MALPTASDNVWPKLILAEQGSAPSAPAAGQRTMYVDSSFVLRWKDDASLVSPIAALNKWDGTTAPTANEDSGDGYAVGSRWIDTTNDKEYVCLDASSAAAVWTETTATAGAASSLQSARYVRTSGDYTITGAGSNTFADVDGTNMSFTFTTGARRVLLGFAGSGTVDNVAGIIFMDVTVDGTRQGGDAGIVWFNQHATASERMNLSFTWLTDTLSAASHTFKLQWRQTNTTHTATIMGNGTGGAHAEFYAIELYV